MTDEAEKRARETMDEAYCRVRSELADLRHRYNADVRASRAAGRREGIKAAAKLTPEMIEAAAQAFYGKRRAAAFGGARGITVTDNNRDIQFPVAFRTMWNAAKRALLDKEPTDG